MTSSGATVVPLPGTAPPRQVDIVRSSSGFALAIVDADGSTIRLRLLDDARRLYREAVPDPWLVMPGPHRIAFITSAMVRGADRSTILVAALGRDPAGGMDRIMLTGYVICDGE